jgi:DNA end-binding protein Ku
MAARPIWRGHLRLALVSCPVALYNARHDRASIRFNLINPETGNRIRMITQDGETGKELERRDLDELLDRHHRGALDLDAVEVFVTQQQVFALPEFVAFDDTASIDPVYYDSAYFLR